SHVVPQTTVSPSMVPHTTVAALGAARTDVLAPAVHVWPLMQSAPPQVSAHTTLSEGAPTPQVTQPPPSQFALGQVTPHVTFRPSRVVAAPHCTSTPHPLASGMRRPP